MDLFSDGKYGSFLFCFVKVWSLSDTGHLLGDLYE